MRKASKKTIALKKRGAVERGRALPKREFPAHLRVKDPEEWRNIKRSEWREVTQAIERYTLGSAYTPAYSALYDIQRLTRQLTEALEAEGWVAW